MQEEDTVVDFLLNQNPVLDGGKDVEVRDDYWSGVGGPHLSSEEILIEHWMLGVKVLQYEVLVL